MKLTARRVAVIDDDMGPGPHDNDPPQRPAQLPAVVGTLEEPQEERLL